MKTLRRTIGIVVVLAIIELLLERFLVRRDPIAALVGGDLRLLLVLGPLYVLRLFLYFVAPPWLAVRLVVAVTDRRRSN